MSGLSVWHWLIVLIVLGVPILLLRAILVSRPNDMANTWKFSTVVFVILAFIYPPFYFITIPLFLFLSYLTYKAGAPSQGAPASPESGPSVPAPRVAGSNMATPDVAQRIAELYDLLNRGALTQQEFDDQKHKILTT
jgi:hypothetical protein